MTEESKKYLIEIFIKKCTMQSSNKNHLDFKFKWCENTFKISKEKVEELKKKFTIDEYINRIVPIIDNHFSEEDLKSLIQFYSSDVGKKLINPIFMREISEVWKEMDRQMEQEFMIGSKDEK
jgi:hypothetical protein